MLTVREVLDRKGSSLQLELLSQPASVEAVISIPEISSPGLVLAGFTQRFVSDRVQVLGQTEISYLMSLSEEDRRMSLTRFFSYDLPCVFVTKALDVPPELVAIADERGIPVIRTRLSTADFYRKVTPYLEESFAPSTVLHGSLADVYGVGLLFVGRSGIGKSECVLDLVERGHRLVADDTVHVVRRGSSVLMGRANDATLNHMEIRGVGLIDVRTLFGVRSVRQQKRIEVVVVLEDWETARNVDRTGLQQATRDVLGVEIPEVTIPLNPGKNITVVSEVVAMNHLLRYSGVDSAHALNERLIARMAEKRELREYLSEDYE